MKAWPRPCGNQKHCLANQKTINMKKYELCFLFIVVAGFAGCGSKDNDYDASGVFEATETIVSAKATGEIMSLKAEEGQYVRKGEALGYIDMTQLALKRKQLDASKAAADAGKTAADSHILDLNKQLASIRQQIANQQRELNRYQGLLDDSAATQKQVDDIRYQISVLQQQLVATQEQIEASNRSFREQGIGLEAQGSGVDAQSAQVDDQMKNSVITSPVSGIILTKYAEQGEWAAPGRALFKVADIKDMKLRAYITADQLTAIKIGQKVKVYSDVGKNGRKEYNGIVVWISDKAEFTPKTIQTRDERANLVYAVKIRVRNDGLIKRGMYGDVKF